MTQGHTRLEIAVLGDLLLSVSVAGTASGGVLEQRDIDELMAALRSGSVTRYLAGFIGSASSTAVQRKEGAELIRSKNIPVAVVTDDRLVRGFVTAVSWIGANVSAFSWSHTRKALEYLGVTGDAADEAIAEVSRLRTKLGVD